jgi:N-acetyl-alpha-D-glucosaminyl L-malate synthase BshA
MVGDGPERGQAEWEARSRGIDQKIHFLGKQNNIEEWIGISDLLLLPSETESFGLVALEAMACEVPVVASRTGGLPEVITDGREGYLVDPGNIDEMAKRAISILIDESKRTEMGKRAREKAHANFCSEKIISMYEEYYQRILQKP